MDSLHNIRLTRVEQMVYRYLRYISCDVNEISSNKYTDNTLKTIAKEISLHINVNNDSRYFFKKTKYNLNLLGPFKYKIYIGINAIHARDNFQYMKKFFNNEYIEKTKIISDNIYRIEIFPVLPEKTIQDHLENFEKFGINQIHFDDVINLLANFVEDNYIKKDFCVYPNDVNIGNYLIKGNELFCIDYDHIIETDFYTMVENISTRFASDKYECYQDSLKKKLLSINKFGENIN